jgi:hypothetical protein
MNIQFQQWTTVDCSELVQQILPFCILLGLKTEHSYIGKAQAKYLKKCKEERKENEVIVLGDFAENYKFVIRDEIQGFSLEQTDLYPISNCVVLK